MTDTTESRREKLLVAVCFAAVALSALIVASIFAFATLASRESSTTLRSLGVTEPSPSPTVPGVTKVDYTEFDRCQGPLAPAIPSTSGLVLELDFPATAKAGSSIIEGTTTLTNTSSERRQGLVGGDGYTEVVLSSNGSVRWHTPAPTIMLFMLVSIDLEPGESLTQTVSFTPKVCAAGDDDDHDTNWRQLPRAAPGTYQVSAFFHYGGDGGDGHGDLPGSGPVISAPDSLTLE